jgi:hypothetical protein
LATALLVLLTAWLALLADDDQLRVYALGDWPAPFGIVLVVDRLAAAMTLLTAVLGFVSLLYASAGFDQRGRHFHPLFQLQLLGLLGAFLTGDLFNLFVFFEVMLLASYTLLAHAGGLERTRAGITYVVLNLLGSALFLIALGLLYGTLGTLNLADLAYRLTLPGHDQALARLAFALLIAVFLPSRPGCCRCRSGCRTTYSAAGAPVAALFAIMTKVGIVAILRVQVIALAPTMPDLLDHWLTTLALATVVFAALGTLVAVRLRALAAWLVLLSAGASAGHAGTGECRGQRGSHLLPGAIDPGRRRFLPARRRHCRAARQCRRPLHDPRSIASQLAESGFPGRGDDGCRFAAFLRLRRQADAADDATRSRRRPGYLGRPAVCRLRGHDRPGARRLPSDLEKPQQQPWQADQPRPSPGRKCQRHPATRRRGSACWPCVARPLVRLRLSAQPAQLHAPGEPTSTGCSRAQAGDKPLGARRHAMIAQDPAAAAAVVATVLLLWVVISSSVIAWLCCCSAVPAGRRRAAVLTLILLAEPATSRPALAGSCVFLAVSLPPTSSLPTGVWRGRSSGRYTGYHRP